MEEPLDIRFRYTTEKSYIYKIFCYIITYAFVGVFIGGATQPVIDTENKICKTIYGLSVGMYGLHVSQYLIFLGYNIIKYFSGTLNSKQIKHSHVATDNTFLLIDLVCVIILLALPSKSECFEISYLKSLYIFNVIRILLVIAIIVIVFISMLCYFGCMFCIAVNTIQHNENVAESASNNDFIHNVNTITGTSFRFNHRTTETLNIVDLGPIGETKCCICMTKDSNTKLNDCGHNSYCNSCVKRIHICSLCRAKITSIVVYSGGAEV